MAEDSISLKTVDPGTVFDDDPKCDCWRLVKPLMHGDTLPVREGTSHVCVATEYATVVHWLIETFARFGMPRPVGLRWPAEHKGRMLGLVIREWVIGEESGEVLARQFANDLHWSALLKARRALKRAPSPTEIATALRMCGFPDNPSVIDHFAAVASGNTETPPPPHRGLLVTTRSYVLALDGKQGGDWGMDGCPEFDIEGFGKWDAGPLHEKAAAVVQKHAQWLSKFTVHEGATKQAFHAALLPDDARKTTDYREEVHNESALESLWKEVIINGTEHHQAATGYVDKVLDRVRHRLRNGVPPPPPSSSERKSEIRFVTKFLNKKSRR